MRKPSAWQSPGHVKARHAILLSRNHLSCRRAQCPNRFVVAIYITRPPPVCFAVRPTVREVFRRSVESAACLASGWTLQAHSRYTSNKRAHEEKLCLWHTPSHPQLCSVLTLSHTLVTMMKPSSCARVPRAASLPVDENRNFDSTELPVSCASDCFSLLINLPRSLCPCSYGVQTSSQEQEAS